MAQNNFQGQAAPAEVPTGAGSRSDRFLGFSTSELAGLSVDEIVGNKQAVTMIMHYYGQLSEENASLRNDLNTTKTYVHGYEKKRNDTNVGASLQFLGSIFLAFGVNILTSDVKPAPGILLLIAGIATQGFGLYFSLRRENK